MKEYITLEDTVYFWFASNDTSGSGNDGATAVWDVRLAGATASDIPILSGSGTLLSHANYPAGCYEIEIAATAANGFAANQKYGVFCTLLVDSQNPTGFVGSFNTEPVISNLKQVNEETDPIDNFELMLDGTGYEDPTAPAQQQQVDNIAVGTAGISTTAGSSVLTTGTQTNTYEATKERDGTYHTIQDDSGETDIYYEFDVGAVGVPSAITMFGRVNGGNDDIGVFGYNWGTSSWEQIGIWEGKNTSADEEETFSTYSTHVGSGANAGKVRIRFYATGLSSSNLRIDQLYISYTNILSAVGYANGEIWVDTVNGVSGTVIGVNGVADNPVDNWADAVTLSGSIGINSFNIAPGSSISLTGDSSNYRIEGKAYTLDLNGQTITNANINGARVSGTGVNTVTAAVFEFCGMGATTLGPSRLYQCGIGRGSGAFSVGSGGQFALIDCFSLVPGSGSPSMDFSGTGITTGINIRGWKGGATITLDSDCTLSHEVLAGGGTTIISGGADVEIRGITRSIDITSNAAETIQFVGTTGVITLNGTTTATFNLYGVAANVVDNTSAGIVNDLTVSNEDVEAILEDTNEIQGKLPTGDISDFDPDSNEVTLKNNSITSSKFDESTAHPIKSADSGNTQIARTGADSDTLETLSDEIAVLESRLTAARAAYLDNLNIGGNVASSAEVTAIQNNTRIVRVVPETMKRPESGNIAYRIELYIYDEDENMEAPDSAPTIGVVNNIGTSRNANLDSTTMSLVSTGRYRSTYTVANTHEIEQLVFNFTIIEDGKTRLYGDSSFVLDDTAIGFTSSDRTTLQAVPTAIENRTEMDSNSTKLAPITEARLAELDAANIPTDLLNNLTAINTTNANVGLVKIQTDKMVFTITNKLDVRIDYVGAVEVTSPDDFKAVVSGLATSSELATHDAKLVVVDAEVDKIVAKLPTNDISDLTLAEIKSGIADGSYEFDDMMKVIFAFASGVSEGGETTNHKFKDPTGVKNRIDAIVDSKGNRSSRTLDIT